MENQTSNRMSNKKIGPVSTTFDPVHLQKALDASGTGVWEINLLTQEAWFSDRAQQIYCFEESQPENWFSQWVARIHPADRERVLAELTTATSSPQGKLLRSYRFQSGDGSYLWLSTRGRVTATTREGKPERFVGFVIDITGQKSLEDKLRESQEWFHNFVDSAPDYLFIVNRDNIVVYANPAFESLLGRPPHEIIGKPFIEIFRDYSTGINSYLDVTEEDITSVFNEGKILNKTGSIEQKGKVVWKNTIISPMRNEQGEITAVMGISRDISPLKRAKENILQLNKQITYLNDVFTIAITTKSFKDFFSQVTGRLHSILSFDAMSIYRLLPDGYTALLMYHEGLTEVTAAALHTIDTRDIVFHNIYAEGRPQYISDPWESLLLPRGYNFQFYVSIPLFGEEGIIGSLHIAGNAPHAFTPEEQGFIEMMGKQVGLAMAKVQARKELVEAHRHANLYLDILTHDINNAITAPCLASQMLENNLEGHEKEIAHSISVGLEQSTDIIRNMETIRSIHERKAKLIGLDLNAVIQSAIHQHPGVAISFDGTTVMAAADHLIKEIFTNIIENSIKYGSRKVQIEITVLVKSKHIEIRIADNGPGIPDDKKSLLFQRFSRVTDQKTGKGLGLYIISSLVHRYGGTIHAEDRVAGYPDLGLAIRFTLKKYQVPATPVKPDQGI